MNKKKCLFVFIMIVAVIAMIKPVYAKESNEPSISNEVLSAYTGIVSFYVDAIQID